VSDFLASEESKREQLCHKSALFEPVLRFVRAATSDPSRMVVTRTYRLSERE
jgi:hypothetical protein